MQKTFAIATLAVICGACNQVDSTGECDGEKLALLSGKIDMSFDEQTQAKAKEHLKRAEESRAKKDWAACAQEMNAAKEALAKK